MKSELNGVVAMEWWLIVWISSLNVIREHERTKAVMET